jgi:hypothetical protein
MVAKNLISGFEICGLVSGGYIGYSYGNIIKCSVLKYSPTLNNFYNNNVVNKFGKFPEPMFWNLVGGLGGMCTSWYLNGWILFIPIISVDLYNKYKK